MISTLSGLRWSSWFPATALNTFPGVFPHCLLAGNGEMGTLEGKGGLGRPGWQRMLPKAMEWAELLESSLSLGSPVTDGQRSLKAGLWQNLNVLSVRHLRFLIELPVKINGTRSWPQGAWPSLWVVVVNKPQKSGAGVSSGWISVLGWRWFSLNYCSWFNSDFFCGILFCAPCILVCHFSGALMPCAWNVLNPATLTIEKTPKK